MCAGTLDRTKAKHNWINLPFWASPVCCEMPQSLWNWMKPSLSAWRKHVTNQPFLLAALIQSRRYHVPAWYSRTPCYPAAECKQRGLEKNRTEEKWHRSRIVWDIFFFFFYVLRYTTALPHRLKKSRVTQNPLQITDKSAAQMVFAHHTTTAPLLISPLV